MELLRHVIRKNNKKTARKDWPATRKKGAVYGKRMGTDMVRIELLKQI
jgi:hypothetical protein